MIMKLKKSDAKAQWGCSASAKKKKKKEEEERKKKITTVYENPKQLAGPITNKHLKQ
jgi:hypothetical protein